MGQLFAYQLKKGDIEAGTECQARDGNLNLKDWVVKCPECGSYTHQECWVTNGNKCPRQGCGGAGEVKMPVPVQQPSWLSQRRYQRPFQLPSRYLSSLQATGNSTLLLSQKCGRDGGRFLIGDKIIRCPRCGTPYHEHCWEANGNRCSQLSCGGSAFIWTPQMGQLLRSSSYRSPSSSTPSSSSSQALSSLYEEGCFEQVLDFFADTWDFLVELGGCAIKIVAILIAIAVCIYIVLFALSSLGLV